MCAGDDVHCKQVKGGVQAHVFGDGPVAIPSYACGDVLCIGIIRIRVSDSLSLSLSLSLSISIGDGDGIDGLVAIGSGNEP
jgi:hypothetical protein